MNANDMQIGQRVSFGFKPEEKWVDGLKGTIGWSQPFFKDEKPQKRILWAHCEIHLDCPCIRNITPING
jgi:hypothetical protein